MILGQQQHLRKSVQDRNTRSTLVLATRPQACSLCRLLSCFCFRLASVPVVLTLYTCMFWCSDCNLTCTNGIQLSRHREFRCQAARAKRPRQQVRAEVPATEPDSPVALPEQSDSESESESQEVDHEALLAELAEDLAADSKGSDPNVWVSQPSQNGHSPVSCHVPM